MAPHLKSSGRWWHVPKDVREWRKGARARVRVRLIKGSRPTIEDEIVIDDLHNEDSSTSRVENT